MKRNLIKQLAITLGISIGLFSIPAFALILEGSSEKTKTIKGYYPALGSVGTKVILGDPKNVKVGDIIAIPTDENGSEYFNLFDKDGDKILETSDYQVVWWSVKPKPGYKWQDVAGDGMDITQWEHIDAIKIDESHYVKLSTNNSSKGVQIPPEAVGSRIAFSIVPETEYGDPKQGQALYAADINFFWKNQDENQKPGMTKENESNPGLQNSNGLIPQMVGANTHGGGNTVELAKSSAIIYIDEDNDGVYTRGVDTLLTSEPTVNANYVVDIKIYKNDGTIRSLNEQEKASVVWVFYNGDKKIQGADESQGSYSFSTQVTNDDANSILRETPPNFSQQGLSLEVQFTYDDGIY